MDPLEANKLTAIMAASNNRCVGRGGGGSNGEKGLVNVIQINAQHKKVSHSLLMDAYISFIKRSATKKLRPESQLSVLLVQEPYYYRKITAPHPNLTPVHFPHGPGRRLRSCIFIDKAFPFWQLTQFTTQDMCTVGLKVLGKEVILSSVYMPNNKDGTHPVSLTLHKLIQHCRVTKAPLIIGCDANAHHTEWGSKDVNPRGEHLLEYFNNFGLSIQNIGTTPTFVGAGRAEVLDLTITNRWARDVVGGWQVDHLLDVESDHMPVSFHLSREQTEHEPIYNVKRTNWDLYISILKESLCVFTEIPDTQEAWESKVEEVEDLMVKTMRGSTTPSRYRQPNRKGWWNNKIGELKRERNRLRKRLLRHYREEEHLERKRVSNKLNREITKAKRTHWQDFQSSIRDFSDYDKIKFILKSREAGYCRTIRDKNGRYSTNPIETLNILLDQHFPDVQPVEDDDNDGDSYNTRIRHTFDRSAFSTVHDFLQARVVKAALKSFKPYKATTFDNIYPIMIQKALEIEPFAIWITELYRFSIRTGFLPKSWNLTKVIFIPKPDKKDYCDPKSFRPISLTSFFLKGLEKVVLWYFNQATANSNLWHRSIYAYRKGISCEDVLHTVVNKIEEALSQDKFAICLFMDISSAFSNAAIPALVDVLERTGVDECIVKWTEQMLTGKTAVATLAGETASKVVKVGCPQGSNLSPLLWNLSVNDLAHNKKEPNVLYYIWADDLLKMVIGNSFYVSTHYLQIEINDNVIWAKSMGLVFSGEKTKAMRFKKGKKPPLVNLWLGDHKIDWVEVFKYLGLWIDSLLNWNPHIKYLADKSLAIYFSSKNLVSRKYGTGPEMIKWLLTNIIRVLWAYGAIVWAWRAVQHPSKLKKLKRVQRIMQNQMTGCSRSVPTVAVDMFTNISCVETYLTERILHTRERIRACNRWETTAVKGRSGSHIRWANEQAQLAGLEDVPLDHLREEVFLLPRFETVIGPREMFEKEVTASDPQVIQVWTDGSKNELEKAGAGYIMKWVGHSYQDCINLGEATVFQCETVAMSIAIDRLDGLQVRGRVINFFTDSQSLIQALDSLFAQVGLIQEVKGKLNKLCDANSVSVQWVPGHEGHRGNEIADRLAKRGTLLDYIGPQPAVPVHKGYNHLKIKKWAQDKHKDKWRETTFAKTLHFIFPDYGYRKFEKFWKWERYKMRAFLNTTTGQTGLNKLLYAAEIKDDPICQCESGVEGSLHFIVHCDRFARIRQECFGFNPRNPVELGEVKLKDIVNFIIRSRRFVYRNKDGDSQAPRAAPDNGAVVAGSHDN